MPSENLKYTMKHKLNFSSSYRQFYLVDKQTSHNTDSDKFWTDQAFADKLAVEKGILGIGIENDEEIVKCELEILNSKSQIDNFNLYDHVVEASIQINSGTLQVLDCPNSHLELELNVEPADYRVRVYSNNLKSAYDDKPKDFYQIEIWKENFSDRIVLKRFHA